MGVYQIEEWKPVVGYEGLYEVNNTGRVRSTFRYCRELKQSQRTTYRMVQLWKNHIGKNKSVHRLVAEAFIPNDNNYPQVNHKDENKFNNNVSNLEWCTASYNQRYGTIIERRRRNTDYYSEKRITACIRNGHACGKPVYQFSKSGELIARYESALDAQRITGINASHIGECCKYKRYKSVGGYVWRFEGSDDLLVKQ